MRVQRIWTDERARGVILQLLLILALLLVLAFIVSNTVANLQRAGLASGYGFLGSTASFDINQRLIQYDSTSTYGRAFVVGGLNTILVACLGILAATIIGFVAGVMRLSRNFFISRIVGAYVEFTRNVPLLIQIIFWWVVILALPKVRDGISFGDTLFLNNRGVRLPAPIIEDGAGIILVALALGIAITWQIARRARKRQDETGQIFPVVRTGFALIIGLPLVTYFLAGSPIDFDIPVAGKFNLKGGFNITPELVALWVALSTYTGAFIAEVVRAGILSVGKGQTEASGALGLRPGLTMRKIILPQALRVIIPPLTSQYLNLTKNSSLAVAIGYQDIVSIGDTIMNQSGQALEVISIYMLFYLTISVLTSLFMNWYNARIALVER
ncbi:amino acid ABC transporter permease [Thioalkalivibrio sp. HK1]|uniref:amino acid ABC transporter permease n=1 Tax=Thioalkalivibrio sp. HK1 TaxID=1469245 RepID=UPI000571595B|nr:amino acid ABC transporter permease [Thioalkalivibrio sp. HK1]